MYRNRTAWRCAVFWGAKVMAAKDNHKEMLPTCGEHRLSRQTVHKLVQKFPEGRTSIEDERRIGRPVEIATPAKNFTPQVSRDV
jgi:hypothetical protein